MFPPAIIALPKERLRCFFWMLACAVVYSLLAFASVRSFWLPSGWALAIMLLYGRKGWYCGFMSILVGEAIFDIVSWNFEWPLWAVVMRSEEHTSELQSH